MTKDEIITALEDRIKSLRSWLAHNQANFHLPYVDGMGDAVTVEIDFLLTLKKRYT